MTLLTTGCGLHRRRRAVAAGGGGGDPYFASVVLLAINDNQADTTTTFDDESTSNKTLTANGNVQYDTAQAPTGMTSSGLFDGAGDFVSAVDSADWDFGTGDFTIEFMIRFNTRTVVMGLLSNYNVATGWTIQARNDADRLAFFNGGTELSSAWTWNPANDTWYHVAVSRSGTDLRGFIDGTQVGGTVTNSTDITGSTAVLALGATPGVGQYVDGWMANVRVTKGVARYTADFTAPTLPLPTS